MVASGEDRHAYWPEYRLSTPDERVGETEETYQVVFQARGKEKTYQVTLPGESDWVDLDDKAIYTLQISLFGKVLKVQKVGS